jgi:hypothetical protein
MPWHQVGRGPGIGDCSPCRGHAEVQGTGHGRAGLGVGEGPRGRASQRLPTRMGRVRREAGGSTKMQGPRRITSLEHNWILRNECGQLPYPLPYHLGAATRIEFKHSLTTNFSSPLSLGLPCHGTAGCCLCIIRPLLRQRVGLCGTMFPSFPPLPMNIS